MNVGGGGIGSLFGVRLALMKGGIMGGGVFCGVR